MLIGIILSLGGLPPLGGFLVKVGVLGDIVDSEMLVKAGLGVLGTVLGGYNYMR